MLDTCLCGQNEWMHPLNKAHWLLTPLKGNIIIFLPREGKHQWSNVRWQSEGNIPGALNIYTLEFSLCYQVTLTDKKEGQGSSSTLSSLHCWEVGKSLTLKVNPKLTGASKYAHRPLLAASLTTFSLFFTELTSSQKSPLSRSTSF